MVAAPKDVACRGGDIYGVGLPPTHHKRVADADHRVGLVPGTLALHEAAGNEAAIRVEGGQAVVAVVEEQQHSRLLAENRTRLGKIDIQARGRLRPCGGRDRRGRMISGRRCSCYGHRRRPEGFIIGLR
jgi:hypothetical protein